MEFTEFIVRENDNNRRIDKILRRILPNSSLAALYKALRKGIIKVNQKKVSQDYLVTTGDSISVARFLTEQNTNSEKNSPEHCPLIPVKPVTNRHSYTQEWTQADTPLLPIEDLFKNLHVRIINKPYNIAVQGGNGRETSLDSIITQDYFREYGKQSLSFRPGPLHRLDKKTTGVLVFSQSLEGARWFSQAVQQHILKKEYVALVEGLIKETLWEESISRDNSEQRGIKRQKSYKTSTIDIQGKKARTYVKPLAYGHVGKKNVTLAHFVIETGRTHQIRLHSSYHGHPLLGDTAYGGTSLKSVADADGGLSHKQLLFTQDFYLHAWKLSFPTPNPIDIPTTIEAPLPENFQDILKIYLPDFSLKDYTMRV